MEKLVDLDFQGFENICMSGGAQGADLQWGMCAGMAGQLVLHWSFTGHNTHAPHTEVVVLTDEQLNEANEAVTKCSYWLKKRPPVQPFPKKLIQRNYFQVQWSDSLYAVTDIVDDLPQGGTGWAVAMFLTRHALGTCPCYVYDQTRASWLHYRGGDDPWLPIDQPPPPLGVWAGIGTRNLLLNGKNAIRTLLNYSPR